MFGSKTNGFQKAQRRAATETAARKLIDTLLHSLDTFLVNHIRTFDQFLCFYKLFSSNMGVTARFQYHNDR